PRPRPPRTLAETAPPGPPPAGPRRPPRGATLPGPVTPAPARGPWRDKAPAEGTDVCPPPPGPSLWMLTSMGRSRPFTGPAEPADSARWMQWAGPPGCVDIGAGGVTERAENA